MDEYAEIVVLDEDDFDEDELRNASRDHRRKGVRSRFGGRSRRRRPTAAVVRSRGSRSRRSSNAGPVVRQDTGGLSYGTLAEVGAQVLAAIQPLPAPPVATGEVQSDVSNMILYQQALAEHAKRDEQLRTLGSLATKLFA